MNRIFSKVVLALSLVLAVAVPSQAQRVLDGYSIFVPTTRPVRPDEGTVYQSQTDHKFYIYSGTAWVAVGSVTDLNPSVTTLTASTGIAIGSGNTLDASHQFAIRVTNDGETGGRFVNLSTGVGAFTNWLMQTGTTAAYMGTSGQNYPAGPLGANRSWLDTATTSGAGWDFSAPASNGNHRFYTGGYLAANLRLTVDSNGLTTPGSYLTSVSSGGLAFDATGTRLKGPDGGQYLIEINGGILVNAASLQMANGGTKFIFAAPTVDGQQVITDGGGTHGVGLDITSDSILKVRSRAFGAATVDVAAITGMTTPLTVAQGGTQLATLTAHAIYVGNGTAAPTALAVCGTGTYVRGAAGADPGCSTLTLPNTSTTGDLMVATGTSAEGAVTAVAAGSYLRANGVGAVPIYSTLTLPNTVVAGNVLIASATNVVSALTPGSLVSTFPANQTANATATLKMNGLGAAAAPCIITPASSGRVMFNITGQIVQNTTADGIAFKMTYGTGAAPANGAAATGTALTALLTHTALTGALEETFSVSGTATGLSLVATWFDLQVANVTGGSASVTNVTCSALEF